MHARRYAVVRRDEDGQTVVDREETITRRVALPPQLENGDAVDLSDTWVDRSYPGSILATAAFTKVCACVLMCVFVLFM